MTHEQYRDYVTFKCATDEECSMMGLVGEAGEVIDYLKKVKHHGHALDRKKLGNEFGDLLFYFVDIGRRHGVHVEDLLRETMQFDHVNALKKLCARAAKVWWFDGDDHLNFALFSFFEAYMTVTQDQGFALNEIMDLNKEKLDARYKGTFTQTESINRAP